MRTRRSRYKQMELSTSLVMIANLLLFVLFLIASANGILWLKITLFILTLIMSLLCLLSLYYAGELTKPRSLWITTVFISVAVCVTLSFILNYPSPNPYASSETTTETFSEATTETNTEMVTANT